ncbi:10894_t:CDS:2, partial [Dentiscutata erythropus]
MKDVPKPKKDAPKYNKDASESNKEVPDENNLPEIKEEKIKEEEIKEEEIKEEEIKEDEIKEAIWEDGIRTIKNESRRNERSRIKSCVVDLIKLSNSSDDIKKPLDMLNEMMQKENKVKHKIYGITYGKVQDTETEQYMIVLDYYYSKRDTSYGMCEQCKRPNTNKKWCQSCDPSKESDEHYPS